MLIDCPGCAKSYQIGRAALGPHGRKVACPHCLTSWFAAPDANSPGAQGDDETGDGFGAPEITAEAISERSRQPSYDELYGTPQKPRPALTPRRLPRLPRTVIAIPALLGVMMAVTGGRNAIVRIWPQASEIYAAGGFPVNARGFDLQNVRVTFFHDDPQPFLVVDGEIANRHAEKAQVPELRLAVRDAAGHEIYTWDEVSPKAKLDGGETIAFRARLAAPPPDGHDVFVRFAAAEPKQGR